VSDYRIDWSGPARRSLQCIPDKVATAVVEFGSTSLAANPQHVGKPLTLGMAGLHSSRRGDYRVIYAIDDDQRAVEIVAIEHRADAYRRT
jgi:mRNA-degrading endonuclease RelE of RelBE toxin-antitoxin system